MTRLLDLKHLRSASDLGGGPAPSQVTGTVASFAMETQQEQQWCWAAVTQSVERWRGNAITQSEIASFHIDPLAAGLICSHPLGGTGSGTLCKGCQADCGDPHSLTQVLDGRGRLTPNGATNNAPSFAEVRKSIDADRPLPVRIEWGGGKGHFVCVTGYAVDGAGIEWVTVHDPLLPGINAGAADDRDLRFATFVTAYPSTSGASGVPNFHYEVQ